MSIPPEISIVVPVYNAEPYLVEMFERLYLKGIRRHAPANAELIVVDDASPLELETRNLAEAFGTIMPVKLVRNGLNLGLVKSINIGLRAASGKYVLLMNSDTHLTNGAVDSLRRILDSHQDIGMVAPVSNGAFEADLQQVSGLAPLTDFSDSELSRIDAYAKDIRSLGSAEGVEATFLLGFCVLFRRNLIDRVGYYDERLGLGYFEDMDYSRRVREQRLRLLVDRTTFVFHGGLKKSDLAGKSAGSQSMRKKPWRVAYTILRNTLYLHYKYRGWKKSPQRLSPQS